MVLQGRANELAVLTELIDRVYNGRSGVLVLVGPAGIGKTALLDETVAVTKNVRVLRIAGTEAEMELPFAALQQLCAPVMNRLDGLPPPQRDALRVAFGLRAGEAPDSLLVGLAVLSLLSESAADQPVVCVIDDAQWLDEASARALAFAGRRLVAESVVMLFAVRETTGEQPRHLRTLPELRITGLRDDDARELLASMVRWPVDADVREAVLAEAGGNPLALMELPLLGSPTTLGGGFRLPELPGGVEESFRRRIDGLPAGARLLLLVAAADPVGDAGLFWRAAVRLGLGREAADPLDTGGLLRVGVRVLFRHPLVRSSAYHSASPADRRKVHAALAEATSPTADPDRRAWHRAQAAAGVDEAVAAELVASAGRAELRGGLAAAAAFLERASELTPDAARRADRQFAAARAKYRAGSHEAAVALLSCAEAGPRDALRDAQMRLLRGEMAFASSTRSTEAPGLLLDTARRFERLDVVRARQTYLGAFAGAVFVGRFVKGTGLAEVAAAARRAPNPSAGPAPADLLLDGLALLYSEGFRAGAVPVRRALDSFRRPEAADQESMPAVYVLSHAAHAVWDDHAWQELTHRHVRHAREKGALAGLTFILYQRLALRLHRGELSDAAALVDEVDAIAAATGDSEPPVGALAVAAWQGREAEVSRLLEQVTPVVTMRSQGAVLTAVHMFKAVLYNGLGRYREARAAGQEATSCLAETGFANWALVELVEAAALSGDRETAERTFNRLVERTAPSGTDWALGVEARSRALLSDGADADLLYREAINRLGRSRGAFGLARARLLYGEWLRRTGRVPEARAALQTASDMFESFGTEAFAARAGRELAATGSPVSARPVAAPAELTAQERQIARRARDGQSNAEIGADLFLSGRTVEWHLRKVFNKLGIANRRELGRALADREPHVAAG